MEECPKCEKWTFSYNPKAEMKVCFSCGYNVKFPFDQFINEKNVINFLSYPKHKRIEENNQMVCRTIIMQPLKKFSMCP